MPQGGHYDTRLEGVRVERGGERSLQAQELGDALAGHQLLDNHARGANHGCGKAQWEGGLESSPNTNTEGARRGEGGVDHNKHLTQAAVVQLLGRHGVVRLLVRGLEAKRVEAQVACVESTNKTVMSGKTTQCCAKNSCHDPLPLM